MLTSDWSETLPGGEIIRQGLADFAAGRLSVPACLVAIARPRLAAAGQLTAAPRPSFIPEPERELYRLLRQMDGDAYSRYNALLRELVSFENALDRQL